MHQKHLLCSYKHTWQLSYLFLIVERLNRWWGGGVFTLCKFSVLGRVPYNQVKLAEAKTVTYCCSPLCVARTEEIKFDVIDIKKRAQSSVEKPKEETLTELAERAVLRKMAAAMAMSCVKFRSVGQPVARQSLELPETRTAN